MLRVAREARMVRIGDSRKILSPAASFSAADSKFDLFLIFSPTCKKSLSRRFCPSYFPILTLHSCISAMLKWSAYFYWLAMSSVNACIFLYIQICFSVIWHTIRNSVNKHVITTANSLLFSRNTYQTKGTKISSWKGFHLLFALKSSFPFVESERSGHVEESECESEKFILFCWVWMQQPCWEIFAFVADLLSIPPRSDHWKRMILMKDRPLEKWWKWQTEKW